MSSNAYDCTWEIVASMAGWAPPCGHASVASRGWAVTEALKAAYSAGYVGAWTRDTASYQLFCERMSLTPFPVQAMALMAYLADRVVRRGLEPAGLTASRSILRTAVTKGRLGWALDETDEALVAQMQRGLVKTYKGQNARGQKDPVTLFHLRLMMGQHASAQEAQDLLQMRLAHGGFLRTGEHANGKLLVGDVEFLTEEKPGALGRVTICLRERIVGVCLKLRQAKTGHLETPPQEALIGRRSDALDVVGPLWDYMVTHCSPPGMSQNRCSPAWTGAVGGLTSHVPASSSVPPWPRG